MVHRHRTVDTEEHIWWADYKFCVDFQLSSGSAPLTHALFKGQLFLHVAGPGGETAPQFTQTLFCHLLSLGADWGKVE